MKAFLMIMCILALLILTYFLFMWYVGHVNDKMLRQNRKEPKWYEIIVFILIALVFITACFFLNNVRILLM